MKKWLCLAGAIVTEVAATLALKGALDLPVLYIVVITGYSSAFLLLSLGLRDGLPLGVAYGVWGATGVALTALLSRLLFDEQITPAMTAGILIVMAGVVLVNLGARRTETATSAETEPNP